MKQYAKGIMTGLMMMITIFMLMATTQAKDDSLNSIMSNLDNYVQDKLGEDKAAGRFQLQSFHIERTHWHYMLDTANGKLYRLEPSRTPSNSKWTMVAESNF